MTVEQLINNLSKFDKDAKVDIIGRDLVITSVRKLNLSPYYTYGDFDALKALKNKLEEDNKKSNASSIQYRGLKKELKEE